MSLEELEKNYYLCDGEILSLKTNLDYSFNENFNSSHVSIELNIRKKITKKRYEDCSLSIEFKKVLEVRIYEDFKSGRDYSDIVFTELENGNFYLSLDPYGNSGIPHEDDNLVIIGKELIIEEK